MTSNESRIYKFSSINHYADFWRYEAGLNVIPADTRNKRPKVEWKQFQHKAISVELHNFWKKEDMFKDGMMIIAGQVWHDERKKGLFLNCIDLDNELAIQEFCKINGQQMALNVVADTGHFTVEQHEDDPTRAHIFVWSDKRAFRKKTSSVSITGDNTNVPRIEVKGEGNDSLVSVTPSPHANGSNYQFIGNWHNAVMEPKILNPVEEHINTICENYGIEYLNGDVNANQNYNPVLRNKQKIPKGQRHTTLVSYANSLIARLYKTTNRQTILRYFETYNNEECEELLPESELKQIFNDAWNNIGKSTTNNYNSSQEDNQKVLSVLEAKRLHSGQKTVIGTITSVSDIYVLEVNSSENIIHKNAKSIQLEDTETLDDNERLDVVLYDDMINNVVAGEIVKITGNMRIEDKKANGKSKKKYNVLHATSIKYLNKKEILVTEKNIESFGRFITYPNLLQRLEAMFAPNIIGNKNIKRGLLRAIVGGVSRDKLSSGRVDTLTVGDPGTAKSGLGEEATEIRPNSRHVSAPHATTKGITAIVDRVNESLSLMLGAIPLSKGGICSIDEINTFSMEDQSRLLDVMQDGLIYLDKFGKRYVIHAPTTIVATLNPVGGKWNDPDVATTEEFNLKRSLMDRFSQIYTTRDNMNEEQIDDFISKMDGINQRRPYNYNFLRKYLIYASNIKDVIYTNEARFLLNKYWKQGKLKNSLTIRMYKNLYKIAEAQAKLQLKNTVDEEIALQTINDFEDMMTQYNKAIGKILGPQEVTYKLCLDALQESDAGMTIEEMCRIVVHRDNQVFNYLGYIWQTKHNHKLRDVVDSLYNHPNIKKIQNHPIILRWLSDPGDPGDFKTENENNEVGNNITNDILENENNNHKNLSPMSPTSPRADNTSISIDESPESKVQNDEYPPSCYYCNEYFDGIGKQCYEKHVLNRHPKKPCYPGLADIELYSLTPKGMNWEK